MCDSKEGCDKTNGLPQCQFFVVRKKRLCRMTVRPGRQYCGEHEPPPEPGDEIDKRIPCPNDPKHTCFTSKLEKHLLKCNARKGEDPPYIEHNVNAPEPREPCPRIPLRDVPEETLMTVINKINKLYDEHIKDTIITFDPKEEYHPSVLEELEQEGRGESSRRHLRQVSRIMQLVERAGLCHQDTCYVEMGAGKGMLSYYMGVSWCARGSRVLAVERAALRHKRDTRVARARRLRADLAHLVLAALRDVADSAALVAVAKHLCGVATDYAVRCATAAATVSRCRGVVLAPCCHHRCDLAGYLATAQLQEMGVSNAELNIIFGVVSWATCGDGRSRELRRRTLDERSHEHPPAREERTSRIDGRLDSDGSPAADIEESTVTPEREWIGRKAKALLDYGRVLYLREKGFRAELYYYVPTTESLENICIVATKPVQ